MSRRPPADPISILYVEDDPDFAELVITFLEREDDRFVVETVTSVDAGRERLRTAEFDCVLSDYDLPGENGIEFLRAVRDSHPTLPFILYTGKGSEEVASEAISAGVTDYLQKVGGSEQYALLANRIRNAVERTRSKQAQERHLKAVESAQEGISILSEAGEYIFVNESYASLYGYASEEMVGEHWKLVYPADEVEVVRREILPAVAEAGYWHGESTGLRADGSPFPEDHVVSQTDHGDLVCIVRDLSDRNERQTELRWKTRAMDRAPVGITISDPSRDGTPFIYANDRFTDVTGYDTAEVIGRNFRFLRGPDTDPGSVRRLREAIDAREPVTVDLDNYRKDGSRFRCRVTITPVEDESGDVTHLVGFQEVIDGAASE